MTSFKSFFQNKNKVISPELTKYEYNSPTLVAGEAIDFNFGILRNFDLSQIKVNNPCRVRLYISLQSRENDRNRGLSTPPSDITGCLIDSFFTNSDFSFSLSPALSFVNCDNPQTSNIYGILENTDSISHGYNINLLVSYPLTEKLDWAVITTDVNTRQLVSGEKIIAQSGLHFNLPSSGEIYIYADGEGITVEETILKPNTLYLFLYDFSKQKWKIINFNQGGGGGSGYFVVNNINYIEGILKPPSIIDSNYLRSYLFSQEIQKSFLIKFSYTALNANYLHQYKKVDLIVQ